MSLKEKLTSILFGRRTDSAPEGEELLPEGAPPEALPSEASPSQPQDPSVIKLSGDHPLIQLYDMRCKEAGHLPAPALCMDEDGVLPKELVQREKIRLEGALKNAAYARLRTAKGGQKEKGRRAPDEGAADGSGAQGLDALPCFFIAASKLYAWMLVFPPTGNGQEITRDSLLRALDAQGIRFGVNQRLVDRLSHDGNRYFTLYIIAEGKPAFDGINGNIVDNFPRVIKRVLDVDEYDQVDYAALNLINNVAEGQEICRLIRPTEGEPGRTVLDQEIPAKSGKSVPLPKGRNTEISEDGDSLIALSAGHVEFTNQGFQVKPVLDIDGNVDFSTGNIKFLGDVNIKGDVLTGFSVQAMGSIWVGGVIESGSTVEAGGDLTVVKGILGDGSTVVKVQRCIFTKYVENATVYVRENLQTDAIINASVYCDGEVLVRSGRGSIIGGRVWAAQKVDATAVGSKSECRTSIVLGGLPCTSFERELIRRDLEGLENELERLEAQLDSPAKASLMSKAKVKLNTAELRLQQLEEDLKGIQKELEKREENGRLECGVAYAGTEISIGDEMIRLRQENRQCIAKMLYGEIVLM